MVPRSPRRRSTRFTLVSSAVLCLVLPSPVRAQDAGPLGIESVRLADGVHLFRAPSDLDKWTSSNSVAVITDDGVVVFDSNTLPSTTRMVLARIRELTDQPVRAVINSHWHMDHWSGNEVYADAFPGLAIVATYTTRNIMATMPPAFFRNSVGLARRQARLDSALQNGVFPDGTPATDETVAAARSEIEERAVFDREVAAVRRVLPTTLYSDSLSFTRGGVEFRLYSVTGDAAGSTVLYLPAWGILVVGDVLPRRENGEGGQPWTMNSYAVSRWLAALQRLETFEADVIVPGQGPPMYDGSYLRITRELYQSLITQTRAALAGGAVRLSDVRAQVDVEDFKGRYGIDDDAAEQVFDQVIMNLVRKIIEEAHDGARPPA